MTQRTWSRRAPRRNKRGGGCNRDYKGVMNQRDGRCGGRSVSQPELQALEGHSGRWQTRAGLTKSRLHRSLMAAALPLALFGCGGQTATPAAIRAETSATGAAAPETSHCRPPSPITDTSSGLEIKATSQGGTVWALMEGPAVTRTRPPTIVAGRPVKVIWRATGSGDLAVVAVDEEGLTLTSAPEAHTGSTWIRPGDEWGSGFTFPHAGCWQLVATRGGTRGTVWLVVSSI